MCNKKYYEQLCEKARKNEKFTNGGENDLYKELLFPVDQESYKHIDELIAMHLLRDKQDEVVKSLILEAGINMS